MLNISNMGACLKSKKSEEGLASIIIVMVLMTLLALISIGFSTLMNRESRQSLDRQLSAAAYYAAESGVNDARDYLAANPGQKINGCETPNHDHDQNFVNNGDISGDGLFKYTCVIVDPAPKELTFELAAGESKIVKIDSSPGNNLDHLSKIYFGWQNNTAYGSNGPQPLGSLGVMPQQTAVGGDATGLLRVGLYPMVGNNGCSSDPATYSRYASALGANTTDATIECASRNYFMYPSSGLGGAPNCAYAVLRFSKGCVKYTNIGDNGGIVPGNCTDPPQTAITDYSAQATPTYCNTEISDLIPIHNHADANHASSYYIRLTAVYKPLRVYMQATDDSPTPKALEVDDAQAVIDVTGSGNDIDRRIQVRAPLHDAVPQLNFSLQSMESICKLFRNDVVNPNEYAAAHLDSHAGAYNTDNFGSNCSWPTGSNVIDHGGLPGAHNYPPPTVDLWADPNPINKNDQTTLKWNSTNADGCEAAGGPWGGSFEPDGSYLVGPLTDDTDYTISCTGPGGGPVVKTVTVHINHPAPTCTDAGVQAGGTYDGFGFVTIWAAAGGCDYYRAFDDSGNPLTVIGGNGWNGGGIWGPISAPGGFGTFCFTQKGGTFADGFIASSTWCD